MIEHTRRAVARFLASPRLALGLIVFVGVWSTLATMVPQGDSASIEIVTWAADKGFVGTAVEFVGLHQAFVAPVFLASAILLTLSTVVCSWNRTAVALKRARALRAAALSTCATVAARHDLEIGYESTLTESEVLDRAADALATLGVKTKRTDGLLSSVSPPWTVWGSPVFHWALVVFALAAFAGVLLRAEGPMAIAVGETKADKPPSYVSLDEGAWYDWNRVERSIRVDAFDPAVTRDGIDLGAVPTVSVLDSDGTVLVTQEVFPNNKLHSGSLSINAPACGLALTIQLTTPSGQSLPPVTQLVDFSQETSGGTVPVAPLVASDDAGRVLLWMMATVPLDRTSEGYGEWIPKEPSAYVVLEDGSDTLLYEGLIRTGEPQPLAGGGTITLIDTGWFAWLSLVDDPSIPYVYASMIAAMFGLTLSLVGRQQLVVAAVVDGPEGRTLAVNTRLWRNAAATREEIEAELTRVLGTAGEGTAS
ncbi:MAG: cytochrome c biogenesis protein ResB [Coriobacteriia bacterium]